MYSTFLRATFIALEGIGKPRLWKWTFANVAFGTRV